MRAASLVLLGVLGILGCQPLATEDTPVPGQTTAPESASSESTPPAADNTAVNERDANADTKTPIDQDETQRDVNITAEIRQRILNTEGMSINAQNAKVITAGGEVTLRGPVDSAEERDTIDKIAREIAGEGKVENQLEIAGTTPLGPETPAAPEKPASPTSDTPEVPEKPAAPETPADPEKPATPAPPAAPQPAATPE